VRFTHADSEICEFQIPVVPQQASETELLLTIAAELPSAVSQLPESRVQARPVCPGHSHPAMPSRVTGRLVGVSARRDVDREDPGRSPRRVRSGPRTTVHVWDITGERPTQ